MSSPNYSDELDKRSPPPRVGPMGRGLPKLTLKGRKHSSANENPLFESSKRSGTGVSSRTKYTTPEGKEFEYAKSPEPAKVSEELDEKEVKVQPTPGLTSSKKTGSSGFGAALVAMSFLGKLSSRKKKGSIKYLDRYSQEEIKEDRFGLKEELEEMDPTERMWALKVPQRLSMAALAVALLWLSSLTLIDYIFTYVVFPRESFDTVFTGLEDLFNNIVERNKVDYTGCATINLNRCQNDYAQSFNREIDRLNLASTTNEQNLVDYEVTRVLTKTLLNETLNQITELNSRDNVELVSFFIDGQVGSCPRIENWITGNSAAGDAASTYDDYVSETQAEIDAMKAEIDARDEFNEDYLAAKREEIAAFVEEYSTVFSEGVGNITEGIEEQYNYTKNCLVGNVSAEEIPSECDGEGGVIGTVNEQYEAFEEYAAKVYEDFEDMQEEYQEFADTVNSILGIAESAGNILGSDDERDPAEPPPGEPEFPETLDDEREDLETNVDVMTSATDETNEDTISEFEDSAGSFEDTTASTFTDENIDSSLAYDPPPVNLDAEAAWNESVGQLRSDLTLALDDFGTENVLNAFKNTTDIITAIPNATADLISSASNTSFDLFAYSPDLIRDIAANFDAAAQFAKYADIIYRLATTVAVINKYWNLSAIGKPPADVRVETMVGAKAGLKEDKYTKMAKLVTHPAVMYVITLIFVTVISVLFFTIYTPFFDSYKDGCVDHDSIEIAEGLSDGTFLYNNMYTVTLEYAVSDGTTLQTTEINKLNVEISADCEQNFRSSVQFYENQVNRLGAIIQDFNSTVGFRNEIVQCLDLAEMDSVAASTGAPTNIEQAATSPEFDELLMPMELSFYNCDAVRSCDNYVCEDPALSLFRTENHKRACQTEWFIHANFLSLILVTTVFVLVNYSRFQFMNALVRLNWRNLNPFDHTYLASCTIDGKHIDPEKVATGRRTMRKHITERLQLALREWELAGYRQLFMAIAINLPWIIAVAIFSQGASYDG